MARYRIDVRSYRSGVLYEAGDTIDLSPDDAVGPSKKWTLIDTDAVVEESGGGTPPSTPPPVAPPAQRGARKVDEDRI